MDQADLIRLRHMRDATAEALAFAAGKARADLDRDRMLILAIMKDLEIVGEAAGKVSRKTKDHLAAIAWEDIVGMRNRLIHGYFDVDLDVVWETITNDLPQLLADINAALGTTE